jgi:hypothetical protein
VVVLHMYHTDICTILIYVPYCFLMVLLGLLAPLSIVVECQQQFQSSGTLNMLINWSVMDMNFIQQRFVALVVQPLSAQE